MDRPTFVYSSYWGTWSRLLWSGRVGQYQAMSYIEVNLTPINGRYDNSTRELWMKEVAPIIIREHGTVPDRGDKSVALLPPMVVTAMLMNVGEELTNRLITHDLLAEIDLDLMKRNMRGGGIPLAECKKV